MKVRIIVDADVEPTGGTGAALRAFEIACAALAGRLAMTSLLVVPERNLRRALRRTVDPITGEVHDEGLDR